ncbi:intestinal mucin-like protein [Hyperolius riggenbachi]|uniref:intestinal mucin-like protein n=1 Tax=Hyperolius riggenbachi TaxID=752182 RepID=UPI0035A3C515
MGYQPILGTSENGCCVTVDCRPMDVCIANEMVYQVGQVIPTIESLCLNCTCADVKDPDTGFNRHNCVAISCIDQCSLGYVYEQPTSGCCGSCVRVSCIAVAPNGTLFTVQPGELIIDSCTEYTCANMKNNFITKVTTKACPQIQEEDCESGQLETTPDGCCTICKAPKSCLVQSKFTVISQNGCSANISISYCDGFCPSLSKFSSTSMKMERTCECCIETASSQIEIELTCPGGQSNLKIFITSAKSCACTDVKCVP